MIITVNYKKFYLFLMLTTLLLQAEINGQGREVFTLQSDWKFQKGQISNAAAVDFNDSAWEKINIPHDWAIAQPFILDGDGNTAKLPWKEEGWYRKTLHISEAYKNKRVLLIFDGVMAFPEIYVNNELAGTWDYGYNSFYLDITDYLNFEGINVLAVHADTRQHDSRWYPGGGLYRKMQMLVVNPVYMDVWGTYISTPIIKPNYADVRIITSVQNTLQSDANIQVEQVVLNPQGQKVASGEITGKIAAKRSKDFELTLEVINPELWDLASPNLYRVITTISRDNELLDNSSETFGIRTMQFTADDGFYLNNKRVQLKGVNMHSDFGPLGVAFNYRAMERQLEIMKSMGVNAIRNSHNIAAPEMLALCDKMGLLFFNEIFDKYDAKAGILGDTDFDEFAHRNIKNFVMRDRNHPSVFLWSVGNEIGDVQNNIDNGFKRLHTMVNYVNKYDPTRPATLVNDDMKSAALRHFDYYDVHSYNYGRRYRLARQLEPNKSVIISESASTVSTRGFYEFPLPEVKTDFTKALQISSYDLNAPEWAEISDDDFMWQQEESYIAGEFVWTGFDYLGEPTPYRNEEVLKMGMTDKEASRSSYFGIVDLVGIPKDRYYLYKSYWKPEETTIHILPHWNWKDRIGKNVPVFVYTNGDSGELFVNGKSQGIQYKNPKSENSTERFRLMWRDVAYEPGEVKVVVYKNGKILGEEKIKTAGDAYKIKLSPDRMKIKADGSDLSYVLVEAYDKDENLAPLADDKITVSIKGKGFIAGVGNGNPQSFAPFKTNTVKLFYGKAMVILQSGLEKGVIEITAGSDKLKNETVKITVE